ncbi:unnamed protein product [Cyprideis torosa]|uniref:Uncharacterized protein n=1 Tax=Cyprideis torosa TaxID=163714 RepID=A0A7R8WAF5_9CRUS|nr:unnamed protein product [Cyprideis torosa]CAG0888343.1 unnamed protein product [Cyprideis torosa]
MLLKTDFCAPIRVDRISVRLGEWEVNSDKEFMSHEDYSVSAVNIHPDYKPGPEFNDIAVLLLKDEVVIRDHIHTVCLPVPQEKFDDKRCVATGWGKDAFEGKYSEILKKVLLPVVDRGLCEEALRRTRLGKHFHLHEHFLCAGGEFARDTCTGDGGGPLVCPVEGHYILAGIASWGIGCGQKNVPGVYVSVPSVMPWIDSIIAGSEWFSRPRTFDPTSTRISRQYISFCPSGNDLSSVTEHRALEFVPIHLQYGLIHPHLDGGDIVDDVLDGARKSPVVSPDPKTIRSIRRRTPEDFAAIYLQHGKEQHRLYDSEEGS